MKRRDALEVLKEKADYCYDFHIDIFNCNTFRNRDPVQHCRQLESLMEDNGVRGLSTGMISLEAFQTKLKKLRGEFVSSIDNISLEHPVPYRVIATYCLQRKKPLTKKQFISVWVNNLVTAIVTARQNKMLIKFQEKMVLGDPWEDTYAEAGIVLMEDPDFRNSDIRKQYGLEPIKRGRKKNAK